VPSVPRRSVEAYHEECKAEGLDRCQLRDFQVISRYIDLVAVAYGLLRAAAHAETLLHKVQHELKLDLEDSVKAECTRCLLWAHPSNALIWLANS
jgi:hypothetical protein